MSSPADLQPLPRRSINPELFQSPSHKRPRHKHTAYPASGGCSDDDVSSEVSMKMRSTSTAPTSSPVPPSYLLSCEKDKQEADRNEHLKRSEQGQLLMKQRFQPYKRRKAPPPLELRFAMKSIGSSSLTDIDFEDAVEVSLSIFPRCVHHSTEISRGNTSSSAGYTR